MKYFPLVFLSLAHLAVADPLPVPTMQVLPEPHQQLSFQREGREIARYHYEPGQQRPFIYPVIGPSGRSLTRMGHPRDPEGHSHHNSVWISHQTVAGLSFWEDRSGHTIKHQRILRFEDSDKQAFAETENHWVSKDGASLLKERRRTTAEALPDGEWMLIIDFELEPVGGEIELGETPFGMLGVRMAKTIGVQDGGGTIRNSEGASGEEGCFRKPARWIDYSGLIAPDTLEGITLMDHPKNPHHPVPFHVRADGWMGAATTFAGALTVRAEAPLRLRYALYVHRGAPAPEVLEARWRAFADSEIPEFAKRR